MEIAIGNREDAIRALKGELQYLGSGAFRDAWVDDANQVVYKTCNDIPNCESDCNREERLCYRDMADRGYRCVAPTYSWVIGNHVVNAQPYYNGPRNEKAMRDLMTMLTGTIYDIHFGNGQNIAFDNTGAPIVIDLQFYDPEAKGRMITRTVA